MSRDLSFSGIAHNPDVTQALRKLRATLGLTQQGLAVKMGTALTTVARWETFRSPRGRTLNDLAKLAEEAEQPDLAAIFRKELMAELGGALRSQFRYAVRHQRQAASGADALRNIVEQLQRLSAVFDMTGVTRDDAIRAGQEMRVYIRELEALVSAAEPMKAATRQNKSRMKTKR